MTLLRKLACVSEFVLAAALFASAALGIAAAFQPRVPDDAVGDGTMYVALGGVLLLPIAVGFALAGTALLKNWRPQWVFQMAPVLAALLVFVVLWILDRA